MYSHTNKADSEGTKIAGIEISWPTVLAVDSVSDGPSSDWYQGLYTVLQLLHVLLLSQR